jgi:hypothetical protein
MGPLETGGSRLPRKVGGQTIPEGAAGAFTAPARRSSQSSSRKQGMGQRLCCAAIQGVLRRAAEFHSPAAAAAVRRPSPVCWALHQLPASFLQLVPVLRVLLLALVAGAHGTLQRGFQGVESAIQGTQ